MNQVTPAFDSAYVKSKSKKKRRGPESEFYDTLKGSDVVIELRNQPPGVPMEREARLVWVDVYSVGLEIEGERLLLYKSNISTIRAA